MLWAVIWNKVRYVMWSLLTRLCSVSKKEVVPTATTTTTKKSSFFTLSPFLKILLYLTL